MGICNPTREEIRKVAEATTVPGETIHATWFEVTADKVEAAIWTANDLAKNYYKKEV
jgi:glycerol dehydrogenase